MQDCSCLSKSQTTSPNHKPGNKILPPHLLTSHFEVTEAIKMDNSLNIPMLLNLSTPKAGPRSKSPDLSAKKAKISFC